jgi:hypothetical protein
VAAEAPPPVALLLGRLARRARTRLVFSAWLRGLARSSGWLALLPLLAVVVSVAGIASIGPAGLALVPAAWLLGAAALAWVRRPGAARALARLDERLGTHEALLSAHALARDDRRGPGGDLHLLRAGALVEAAERDLARALPLVPSRRVWALPLAVVAALLLPLLTLREGAATHDRAGDRALEVARSLEREAERIGRLRQALDPEQQERLAELEQELKEGARKLEEEGGERTRREVLEALEERAHQAERLARELAAEAERVSSALLAELERHADTAEMAGAVRGARLEAAATEAETLARRLRNENLSVDAEARIEDAFRSGLRAATPEDLNTQLGRRLSSSLSRLEQQERSKAAAELEALARDWRSMARRARSQELLAQLAENLRAAGQQALGRTPDGLKQLAEVPQGPISRVGSTQAPPPLAQPGRNYQQRSRHAPPPSNATPGQAGSPVPGTAPPGTPHHCPNCGRPQAPGAGPPPPGGTSGAPIPGTTPSPGGT